MKFYLVVRPSLKDTTLPVYYYTFAKDESEAQTKIQMKWSEIDDRTIVKEVIGDELDKIVIATDYYG